MEEKRFRVIFTGEILPGRDFAGVKEKLVKEQGLSPEKAGLLFSGKRVVLKEDADRRTAMQIKNALLAAGALCRVEPTGPAADLPQKAAPKEDASPNQEEAPDDKPPEEEPQEAPMTGPAFGASAREAIDLAVRAIRGRGSSRERSLEEEADFRLIQAMITGALVTGLVTFVVVGRWATPQVALLLDLSVTRTLISMGIFIAIVFCGVRFGWKALLIAAVIGAFSVQIITGNRLSLPGLTVLMAVFPVILLLCTIGGALPGAAAGYLIWEADQKRKNPADKDGP